MDKTRYLDKINCPQDLKGLKVAELNALAAEMREFLIHTVSKTGGHLASNLGVIDLALALHFCLDSPTDKLLWDVGHQSYPHKIITGRKELFNTLRQFGGLSGYIKSSESPHDAFDVGHSSTSLSAAHGFAVSRDLLGLNHKVAAVIGDGAITSGLALEAMNNIGRSPADILVVLNDNQMSISENVGALARYLEEIRTAPSYISAKKGVRNILQNIPALEKFVGQAKDKLKNLLLPGVLFEELGFKYYGPVDGHNLGHLIEVLEALNEVKGPVMLHVITQKGKGYEPAERNRMGFHGVEPFNIKTGLTLSSASSDPALSKKVTYTDVFADKIVELGAKNDKIVVITAAMPTGTGLEKFSNNFPKRFFDVGIAESHAVTFAAGLAKSGLRPVVAIYSTFIQRAYDQIIHDVCLQNLPVIFALDRAGVVGADGETHQGAFDLSFLSHMPRMTILAPRCGAELEAMLDFAVDHNGPVAIRYPKDEICGLYASMSDPLSNFDKSDSIELGKWEILEHGHKIAIVAVGSMMGKAHGLRRKLLEKNYICALMNPRFVKPLCTNTLIDLTKFDHIFTLEDNVASGGFGQNLAAALAALQTTSPQNAGYTIPKVHIFALPDDFPPQGKREEVFAHLGLDIDSMLQHALRVLKNG